MKNSMRYVVNGVFVWLVKCGVCMWFSLLPPGLQLCV